MNITPYKDVTIIDFSPYPHPASPYTQPGTFQQYYQYMLPTPFYLLTKHYFKSLIYYPGVVLKRDETGKQIEILTFLAEGYYSLDKAYKRLADWEKLDDHSDPYRTYNINTDPLIEAFTALNHHQPSCYETYAARVYEMINPKLIERISKGEVSREEVFWAVWKTYRGTPSWIDWVTDEIVSGEIQETLALYKQNN